MQASPTPVTARLLEDSRELVHELTGLPTHAMSAEELVETLESRLREVETLEEMRDMPSMERAFLLPLIESLRERTRPN